MKHQNSTLWVVAKRRHKVGRKFWKINLNSHCTRYIISYILVYLVLSNKIYCFVDEVLCFKNTNMPNIFRTILLCLKHYDYIQ